MMQADNKPGGSFVAVVGPSGAGKDTIMDAARVALANDTRFHFVRRIITRPQMPGTEDHDSLDEAAFAKAAGEVLCPALAGAWAELWIAEIA